MPPDEVETGRGVPTMPPDEVEMGWGVPTMGEPTCPFEVVVAVGVDSVTVLHGTIRFSKSGSEAIIGRMMVETIMTKPRSVILLAY